MPRSPDAFQLAVSALQASAPVKRLCAGGSKRIEIGGAWGSAAAAIVGLMGEGHGRLIALAGGVDAAETLALDLNELFPELPVHLLPVAESELEVGPERRANRSERLVAMSSLQEQGDGV